MTANTLHITSFRPKLIEEDRFHDTDNATLHEYNLTSLTGLIDISHQLLCCISQNPTAYATVWLVILCLFIYFFDEKFLQKHIENVRYESMLVTYAFPFISTTFNSQLSGSVTVLVSRFICEMSGRESA